MPTATARPEQPSDPALQEAIVTSIRDAGIAGAGGAGFPTYAKWKDRAWLHDLEALTGGTVYTPDELPIDPEDESGVVFAYTDSTYQYGMGNVLLNVVADTVVGNDLPMDHGWIVQNTETLHNVYRTWRDREPVTRTSPASSGTFRGIDSSTFPSERPSGMSSNTQASRHRISPGTPHWPPVDPGGVSKSRNRQRRRRPQAHEPSPGSGQGREHPSVCLYRRYSDSSRRVPCRDPLTSTNRKALDSRNLRPSNRIIGLSMYLDK